MDKSELRRKIAEYGEAIVTFRSVNSKKLKYNVVTLDFDSCKHIRNKNTYAKEDGQTLLCFAWDTDTYRLLTCNQILTVVPLASVLKNFRD